VPWPAGQVQPVERVRIRNLTLTSSSSAIKFEASTISDRKDVGSISDVIVDQVRIIDTNRGIGIWQRSGLQNNSHGNGVIKDLTFQNIKTQTRFDSKPEFWGSAEPFVITALPQNINCCVGIQNITFVNFTSVAENGALISSLGSRLSSSLKPPLVAGIQLHNVSITIKKIGNTTRPQHDYRPVWQDHASPPDIVRSKVDGISIENIESIAINGGMVQFSPLSGPRTQAYWDMACLNITGESNVHFLNTNGRFFCFNHSASAINNNKPQPNPS